MNHAWTPEIKNELDAIVAKYETKRAPILEILRTLQERFGYITKETEAAVGKYLEIPAINVREVMTFYTLFYAKPRGKKCLRVCRTLTCALLGAADLVEHAEQKLGIKAGETTPDGEYSLYAVECLGACEIAPMMQVDDDEYVGAVTKEKIDQVIKR
ncbi:MAG: NAD(P)H-dependent oxidoreductase subunit E [Candidatus Omnitrophota bacterium]|nr:NAD(P)H-dependent oxidoreductase subunit E [Candidatus Omnitrophota bacterium]